MRCFKQCHQKLTPMNKPKFLFAFAECQLRKVPETIVRFQFPKKLFYFGFC